MDKAIKSKFSLRTRPTSEKLVDASFKNIVGGEIHEYTKLQADSKRRKQCGEPGINGGFFQNPEFKFGANLILKDISKVTALENRIVKNILLKSKLLIENDKNNFIEEEFFDNQKFRKIKKQLVFDIATSRIQEISEIIAFKNINIKSFLNKNLKIFLQINEECNLKSFEKIYKNIFSNNKYELYN